MLDKHLIKATLRALRLSPHPYSRGYISTLQEANTPEVALFILRELSDFYVDDFSHHGEFVAGILAGYKNGAIAKKYR